MNSAGQAIETLTAAVDMSVFYCFVSSLNGFGYSLFKWG